MPTHLLEVTTDEIHVLASGLLDEAQVIRDRVEKYMEELPSVDDMRDGVTRIEFDRAELTAHLVEMMRKLIVRSDDLRTIGLTTDLMELFSFSGTSEGVFNRAPQG
jgi:hypothetical protein